MSSYLVYRASFYLMMTVAAIALCADTTDSRIGWLPPPLVAAAGVVALLTVDRDPTRGLPQGVAKALAVGTLGLLYIEYSMDEVELVRSLGHWLIALQLIKYFLPKSAIDDWFLFLVGLMQVLIGAVINTGDQVGIWLFVWAVLAVWVLGQFFLQREARRFAEPSPSPGAVPAPPRDDPYVGLFDRPYFFSMFRVMAMTLALGFLAFLLIPRQPGAPRTRYGTTSSQHLTGFDEEVALGQLGEILENNTPVMTVEFTDLDRNPISPPAEPLWRGVTLNHYENGRWRRQSHRELRPFPILPTSAITRRGAFRQAIKLEANDSPVLFAIRPLVSLRAVGGRRPPPSLNVTDGTALRQDSRGPYDYEALSEHDPSAPQFGETPPSPQRVQAVLRAMPPELKERLRSIAEPLIEGLPRDGAEAILARGRALESYLLDPREFGYSLSMTRVDSSIDPVEDFLVNRREGHCEYFASALALLLRSIDIPSRMVNGFKGGDWSDITQTMTVREKHAHSWVEAYAGVDDLGQPIWFVFDPTPGIEREESIARVGGLASRLRVVTDLFRHVWVFYIQGYNSDRQNRLLYKPLGVLAREVRALAVTGWRTIADAAARFFHFQNIRSLVSAKGFVVTFLLLSGLVLLARICAWLFRRIVSWWRGPVDDESVATAGILFYRRLVQLLADYDLERSPAETQNEFARRAFRFLSGRGGDIQDVAESPEKIVDAFYQVRFGHEDLPPETLAELERRLDALETALRPSDAN